MRVFDGGDAWQGDAQALRELTLAQPSTFAQSREPAGKSGLRRPKNRATSYLRVTCGQVTRRSHLFPDGQQMVTPIENSPRMGSLVSTHGVLIGAGSDRAVSERQDRPRPFRTAAWYAVCVAQLVTRVDARLLADVDQLVTEGVASTRSDAVRLGLEALVERHRREQAGQAIVDGYRRQPQNDEELAGLNEATRSLIEEEPW